MVWFYLGLGAQPYNIFFQKIYYYEVKNILLKKYIMKIYYYEIKNVLLKKYIMKTYYYEIKNVLLKKNIMKIYYKNILLWSKKYIIENNVYYK